MIEWRVIPLTNNAKISLRKFGLDLIGEIPWGTHVCQLYQTKQDLLDVAIPYFTAGLRSNEYCLWITSPPIDVKEAQEYLRNVLPPSTSYFRKNQLEICTFTEWYSNESGFNAEKSLHKMLEKEKEICSQGFEGLRIMGNSSSERSSRETDTGVLITHESSVNIALSNRKIIAVCAYPTGLFTGENVIDLERNHVGTLTRRDKNWYLIEDAGKRKRNEAWYKNIVQTSLDAFWIISSEGQFLEVNGAFCDFVGYCRDELCSMNLQDLVINEKIEEISKHMENIKTHGHDRFETRLRRKEGMPIDIEISATLSQGDDGQIFVFAHNITRRKRNENAIKQSETRYRELANSIADSFVALDNDLRYIYWNRACEKLTGIKAKDAIGKHLFEVFREDESTRKLADVYLRVLKTKKPRVFIDELNVNNRRIVIENHVYPSKTGVSVFTKDITQRKELQSKLEEYTQQLEDLVKLRTEKLKNAERLAAIGETAGMVGHDIRNPLQTISGELYLAKGELISLPENETKKNLLENIQIISEQIAYISKIVADLQDYARTSVPLLEEIDLEKTVKDIMTTVIVPSDVRVNMHITNEFPKFRADSSYLKRILINLITNAMQAMPRGGRLTLKAGYDNENVIIRVEDTGEGIPEEAKTKIFKPLFTTKPKGQGLGLAVVKKLTDALGGNISFESKIGQGTSFIIEIPLSSR